jgi:ADP-dependent NAD(P)H-hydrate dehydratase / NAD(P)H-hydrate epimerase
MFQTLTLEEIQNWFVRRPRDAHKGLFGHVLIVGGNIGMPGSVRLAAEGALRVGAGIVTVLTHPSHALSVTLGRPELMCYGIDKIDRQLQTLIEKATVIVLGPGLGQSDWSKDLFEFMINQPQIKIIDADGLNFLAESKKKTSKPSWVLTPHPGEAARLLQSTPNEIQKNRESAAQNLIEKWGGIIVLKGENSIIATSDHPWIECPYGNPGMASPGMGDLLSGMIAGCFAQGLTPWQAACTGVYIHGRAGDIIASTQGERGMLASDLLRIIPRLVNPGFDFSPQFPHRSS